MARVVLVALLSAVAASAQTIYRWTDAKGTVHYTDDPSTIPQGAKVSTTDGDELTQITPSPPPKTAKPAAPQTTASAQPVPVNDRSEEEYWRGQFRAANEKVRSLEDELAVDQRRYDDPSRLPMTGSYYCPPGYLYGPWGVPSPGAAGFAANQSTIAGAATVPLPGGGAVTVNGSTSTSVKTGQTVAPFGPGFQYGYGHGYGCWYQMDSEYSRVRERIARNKAALARAQEDLADLERRAANAAVPLEWRR